MKTLTIHSRTILERTGYRAHPYREALQYVVSYDNREYRNGHAESVENPRLRVPFRLILQTRSKDVITAFAAKLGRKDAEKWLSALLGDLCE